MKKCYVASFILMANPFEGYIFEYHLEISTYCDGTYV